MIFKEIVKNLGREISRNSPIILTGIAVSGVLATTIFASKATLKAQQIIENEKECVHKKSFTKIETIKMVWPEYIPTAVCGTVTIASILMLNSVHTRRTAALATVYSITETAFKEYQSKVAETIGKNKELAIRDDISKDKVKKNPVIGSEVILTGKGDILCYDSTSGRYFKSDIEKIRRTVNRLNRQLMTDMYLSLNDLYSELGLKNTSLGSDVGWNIDDGLIELSFSTQLTEDDTPCLVIDYVVSPKWM